MTEPTLRSFQEADAYVLRNRDGSFAGPEQVVAQARRGPAFTAEVDGRPIAAAGVVLLWPGVGSCWMIVSAELGPHGRWLTKMTRRFVTDIRRSLGLHRLEALALSTSDRNQRWLERVGFTKEVGGEARAYLPDRRSMIRYELIERAHG